MSTMCDTRTVKIAKHLHAVAPSGIDASSIDAFANSRAGSGVDVRPPEDDALRSWLEHNPIPTAAPAAAAPLFHATLVFVRVTFHEPERCPSRGAVRELGGESDPALRVLVRTQQRKRVT